MLLASSPKHIQTQLPTISVPSARTRRLALLAILLVLLGAALLVLLHAVSKSISPLSQPISDYALTRYNWLFDLAVVVLAVGLATLLCALVAADLVELGSGSFVATAMCCVCLVVLVVFPDQGSAGGPVRERMGALDGRDGGVRRIARDADRAWQSASHQIWLFRTAGHRASGFVLGQRMVCGAVNGVGDLTGHAPVRMAPWRPGRTRAVGQRGRGGDAAGIVGVAWMLVHTEWFSGTG